MIHGVLKERDAGRGQWTVRRGKTRMETGEWEQLSPEEKKKQLFWKQKDLLDTFLARHAISRAQYEKSLGDLKAKMGLSEEEG